MAMSDPSPKWTAVAGAVRAHSAANATMSWLMRGDLAQAKASLAGVPNRERLRIQLAACILIALAGHCSYCDSPDCTHPEHERWDAGNEATWWRAAKS